MTEEAFWGWLKDHEDEARSVSGGIEVSSGDFLEAAAFIRANLHERTYADRLRGLLGHIEEAQYLVKLAKRGDREWEWVFDWVFDRCIWQQARDLGLAFDYCDPDTTYEADICAYVDALTEYEPRWRKRLE